MTESDLYPDPVEDRVRRTFAVRAEDMAAGDGAGEMPLPRVGGAPGRRPGRALLVAAIVVMLGAAVAAVGIVTAADDDGETGDLADGGAAAAGGAAGVANEVVVDLVTAQRDLVMALQDERSLAAIELIGQADTFSLPEDDPAVLRERTDAAVAALRPLIASGPAVTAYQAASERLGGLAGVRDSVDGYDGPRTFQAVDTANEVFAAYGLIVDGLIDAQGELALTVDDPDLRTGLEVHQLGSRQQVLTTQLLRTVILSTVLPEDSALLTEASQLYAQVRQGQDDLTAIATGTPYEEATVTVLGEVEASGLLDLAAAGLEGPVDLAAILAAAETPADEGWPVFLDRVEAILADAG